VRADTEPISALDVRFIPENGDQPAEWAQRFRLLSPYRGSFAPMYLWVCLGAQ
jgi:hypothetical protein